MDTPPHRPFAAVEKELRVSSGGVIWVVSKDGVCCTNLIAPRRQESPSVYVMMWEGPQLRGWGVIVAPRWVRPLAWPWGGTQPMMYGLQEDQGLQADPRPGHQTTWAGTDCLPPILSRPRPHLRNLNPCLSRFPAWPRPAVSRKNRPTACSGHTHPEPCTLNLSRSRTPSLHILAAAAAWRQCLGWSVNIKAACFAHAGCHASALLTGHGNTAGPKPCTLHPEP